MSEYLQICRGGTLKLFRQNKELIEKYRQKKKEGRYLIIDKGTKEVVHSFPNLETAEDFFYIESSINNIFSSMRSNFYLELDVTLGDVRKALESIEELQSTIAVWFPFFPSIGGGDSESAPAEEMIVSREGKIEGGIFVSETHLGFINTRNWTEETKISLDSNYILSYEDGQKQEFINNYSLLDFLRSLYEMAPNPPIMLTIDGIIDVNGKKIDDPFSFLLSPCLISDELTLNDVFNFVAGNELLAAFIESYSWCHEIDKFHEQAKLPSTEDENDEEKLWFAEIYYSERCYESIKTHYLSLSPELHAIGELSPSEKKHYESHPEVPLPDHTSYSISYTPLNNLKHLGVKLSGITFWNISKDFKTSSKYEAQYPYTLLDIIDAIYWDISFVGGPEEKKEFMSDMQERVDSIKSGETEIEPIDLELEDSDDE